MNRAVITVALGLILLVLSRSLPAAEEEKWSAPSGAAERKNPVESGPKSIAVGKEVYTNECVTCHGAKGKGDGKASAQLERKPGDLSDPKMNKQSDGELFWKVSEGKKPMIRFAKILTESERWHVVNYIRTLAPPSNEQKGQKP